MKKIRLLSVALILSLFVLVFSISCPHGDEAVKGTAKLITPQTVEGAKNVEVTGSRFTIQLSDGAKFLKLSAGLDVKSWFNPQVPGLSYRVERDVNEGADTINIIVEGTPTEMSSSSIVIIVPYQMVSKDENGKEVVTPIIKNGTQNITVGDQKEGSKSLETQSRYAIGETPDKPVAVLDTSLVISGQQGLPFTSSYSATIKLTTGRFASLEAGADVHTWFEPNYHPDLTYTLTNAVRKNSNVANITISGTPKEEARGALKITIPADCLIEKIQTPVEIGAGNSASYNITNAAVSATFSEKVEISGTSNVALTAKTFTITLTGATFRAMSRGYDISKDSTWIINPQIEGLSYTVVRSLDDDKQNQLTIEVSGTPRVGSESALSITIPKSAVVLPKDRENEVKEIEVNTQGSILAIKGPKADLVEERFIIDGRQGIAIVDKEFTVKLTDITFRAFTAESVKDEIKNWFGAAVVDGLTYSIKNDIAQNATEITFVISGEPSKTSTSLLSIVIPKRLFNGAASTLVDMSVNMKSSAYNITALSASMPNTTIEGGKGLAMLGTPLVITLDGDGALFNPTSQGNITFVSPQVAGVDFELQANVAESKSITIIAKGTPSVTSETVFSILIPKTYIKNGTEDVQVTTNASRYNIVDITASLDSMVTINGKKGIKFSTSIPIKVNLQGAKLKAVTKAEFSLDLEKFISPVVPGVTYTLQNDVASESKSFTFVIDGTPTSQSSDILSIKVPMKYVLNADESFTDIGVDVKNSKYNITESIAEIVSPLTITGVTNISKQPQTFIVKLTNEKFVAMTNKEVSWFENISSGIKFFATSTEGSDTATVSVSGIPTKATTAELKGTISASELQNNGSVLANGITINTNGSAYNVTELKLKTKEGTQTVSGTSGNVPIDSKTFTVIFDERLSEKLTFKEASSIDTLDTTWINTIVNGLKFSKTAVTAVNNTELVITVSGTPTEDNGSEIRITIPNAVNVITGYSATAPASVSVDTEGSRYAISGLYASIAQGKTIEGFKDKTIESQELTVNLVNSSFTNALASGVSVASWFTISGNNNRSGLSYTIKDAVKAGDKSATIIISGRSEIAIPGVALVMEIPESYLNGTTQNLRVDTKGSTYNISEISATSNQQIISGTQNVSLSEKKFTITLGGNVKFKPISPSVTWSNGGKTDNAWMKIVDGLEYVLLANSNQSSSAEIVVRGIPSQTINEPISISIPAYFIDGVRTDAPSISVDTSGSMYAIDTLSASVVENGKKVAGTKNIAITSQDVTIKLTGSKFKTMSTGSTDVASWFTTTVPGLTYTLVGSIPSSSATDTSDTAVVRISGTPRSSADATFSIRIPQNHIYNAERDVVVDTNEGKFEISDLEAKITVANRQVSGSQNVQISPMTFSVELTGHSDIRPQFIRVANDTNVKSWFNSVEGLTYTLKANSTASSSLTFEISGTPTAMSSAVLSITIPKNYVQKYDTTSASSEIRVNTNGAMYNISDLSASLTSNNNNVTGSRNITIATKTLTLKLIGTKFNQTSYTDVSSWFVSHVKGLKYSATVTGANSDTLSITISGSPEEITDQKAMQIVIPTSALTSANKAVIVDTKGAVFDIKAPSASINTAQKISGFRDITLSNTSVFTISLVNATFVARSNTDVKEWFTPQITGLSYTLTSAISDGATSAIIRISGAPSNAISETALSIVIPETAIKNATQNKFGTLTVDTKGSSYTVSDWSLKSNEVVIKGTDSGVAITKQTFTITFDNNSNDLTFKSSSAATLDATWIDPLLGGLTFQRLAVTSATNKSITVEVTGTPTATTSSPINITIPNAANFINGYSSKTTPNVSVNTNGSRYAITSLYASLTDRKDITGRQYIKMTDVSLEVNLSQATFKDNLTVGQDVSSWFTANYTGLTYKIAEAVTAGASSAKVTISGTPEVVLQNIALTMRIPVSYLNGATGPLDVDTKGSIYTFSAVTASTNSVTISGSQGIALSAPRSILITLSGATFAAHTSDIDVSSWFSHAVKGLKYNLRPNSTAQSLTAYIDITGTPSETLSEPIVLTIKNNSLILGYSSSAPNVQVDTNGSRHAISSVTARVASAVTVSGTQDISLPANTYKYVINLTNATFNTKTGSVASWVKGAPSGLTYTLESNPGGKSTATVIVAGRPSVTSSATVNFTIPQLDVTGANADILVDTLTSTYDIKALSASMPNTTISGSQNTALSTRTIRITLSNAQFTTLTSSSLDNVRSWFADPIDGLKYTRLVNSSVSNYIDIQISGTPTSSSNRLIEITIPRTAIVNYDQTKAGIVVNTNASKYAIGNVTASLASQAVLNATREVSMTNSTMTVNLSGAQFNAVSASAATADVSDWFTPTITGLSYKLLSGITANSTSAVITVSGTPKVTSSSAIQMAIPASYIKDANDEVVIDTKSSQYNIVEATASISTKQTVGGVTNITLKERDAFTITLTNASFNAVTNITSWFVPQIPGLTYTLARTVSQGDTSISVKIAGMPTSESSETLGIRIPYSAIRGASSTFGTLNPDGTRSLNVDTKSSVYAISSASASITTAKTISGVKDIAQASSQTFTITLQATKFTAINLSNTNGARAWFTNPIDGLSYAISASSGSSTATVTISGTPTVSASASIGIIIPSNYLTFDGGTASKNIVVDANGSVYDIKTPTASINSSTALVINGIRNTKITNQTIVVNLTNATFKNATVANVVSWISPAVNGLSYSFVRNSSTRGTITISGTPTVESSAVISVNIPYTEITNAASSLSALSVDTKNSHYTIGGTEATVRSALSIKGTKGITLQNKTQSFVIDINGALFRASTTLTVTSWISNPNNLSFSGTTSSDGKYITITPTGVPSSASNATVVITIPTSALQGTVAEPIVVNTKGLVYSIDEVSATVNTRFQVDGILNRPFTSTIGRTITLSGNDVTLTGLSTSTSFGTSTYVQPLVPGVTYAITSVSSNNKSFNFSVGGTPTQTSVSTFSITIPCSNIKDANATYFPSTITVNNLNSAYNINEASAKITQSGSTTAAATVSAIQNVSLETAQLVQINLDAATFTAKSANADVSSWFTNRIDGLTYRLQSALTTSSTVAVVKIEGAPRVQSNERMIVKIPSNDISLTKDLIADSNSSVYNITNASASIPSKVEVRGSNGAEITAGSYSFNITLTGVKFAAVSNLDVSSWFAPTVPGLTYKLTSSITRGATTATIDVSGTPTRSSGTVIALTIPNSALLNATNLGALTVDTKESVYNIQDVSLTFSKTVEINGFTNVPLTTGANDFTMTISGAGFAAMGANEDLDDWFTKVDGVHFKTKAAVTVGTKTLSVAVSGTPTKGSTSHIYVQQANMKLDTALITNITMDTKDSVFNIIDVTATFAKKIALSGAKNIPVTDTNNTFTINLTGIKLASLSANQDVTEWVKPTVAGLSFKVVTATGTNSSTVTVKPDGTPTVASENVMWSVAIPARHLQGYTQNLNVDTQSSVYSIVDTTATISETTHIVGTKEQMIVPVTMTINLENGLKFRSMTTTTNLASWFDPNVTVPGLSYNPKVAVTSGSTSMQVSITGTPSVTTERLAVKIMIPPNMVYYDDSTKFNTQSITVDAKASEYQIAAAVTTTPLNLTVTADIEIEPQVFEIYLRGTELSSLKAGDDITDWFTFTEIEVPDLPPSGSDTGEGTV